MSNGKEPDETSLLSAIQSITLWAMNRDDRPEEIDEALSLIESICRHGIPVWDDAEAQKYGIEKS